MLNAPTEIALTFADYIDPEIAGTSGMVCSLHALWSDKLKDFVNNCSPILASKLKYISTGGNSVIEINEAMGGVGNGK